MNSTVQESKCQTGRRNIRKKKRERERGRGREKESEREVRTTITTTNIEKQRKTNGIKYIPLGIKIENKNKMK